IGGVALVALPLLAAAATFVATSSPPLTRLGVWVLFFALTLAADLKPVPMDEAGKSEVSIAGVFIVTTAILLGWQYAALVAAGSVATTFVLLRRPLSRLLFNVSMYAI